MNRLKIISLFILTTYYMIHNTGAASAVMPSSTNYQLQEYTFGSGGEDNASSTNFKLNAAAGEVEFGRPSSTNYKAGSGLTFMMMANVPPAPTFTNPSNYYNKLKIVLATGGTPSDTQFAIAVSPDNFSTTTKYVQADTTLGDNPIWQTYTNWGGASGTNIIGLTPGATYTTKIAARQGNFTQSGYGPTAQAATITPTLVFDIDVSATDTETAAPYNVVFGNLTIAGVTTATDKIWIDLATNAENGGFLYIYDAYAGLKSTNTNYTISSSSTNLASATEGFGIRVNSVNNLTAQSPYDGASDNVGVVDSTIRTILNSNNAPVTAGRGSLLMKAKASTTTPAATDYADTLTIIASGSF